MAKCLACSPRVCRQSVLYVAVDDERGLSKIGITVSAVARQAQYRRDVGPNVFLIHTRSAGCQFTAGERERRALRKAEKSFTRVTGDWFAAPPAALAAIVERTCAGVRP